MDIIQNTWVMIEGGIRPGDPNSPLEMEGFDKAQSEIIIDIARTRKKAAEKYPDGKELFFTSEGLRWATPASAADHCAERLGRPLVLDVTCGQGGQVLSLSRTSGRVIAVDIEPLNCLVTLMNCLSRGIENVTIVNSDCFDEKVVSLSEDGGALFSDPARPPGSEERTLEEITPDPRRVMEAYGKTASGMCFEVPPYLSMEKVNFECEAEYVSIEGRLNRLNLYTGDLKRSERSAVILPQRSEIRGIPSFGLFDDPRSAVKGRFAYELDPAVVRSGLISALIARMGMNGTPIRLDDRRSLLVSEDRLNDPFLKQSYRVLEGSVKQEALTETLVKLGAGSVTLRFRVDPKDYWRVRNKLEEGLSGKRKVQLFKPGDYLILEKLEDRTDG